MGLRAVYIALPTEELQRIEAARRNRTELWEKLLDDDAYPQSHIGDSWGRLHFALTGEYAVFPLENSPLSQAIMGSTTLISLVDGDTHFGTVPAKAIPTILTALEKVDVEVLVAADFSGLLTTDIHPDSRQDESAKLSQDIQRALENIRAFYRKAAKNHYGALVVIS